MPIHQYRCTDCGCLSEVIFLQYENVDDERSCDHCGCLAVKTVSAPWFRVNEDASKMVNTLDGRRISVKQAKAEGLAPRENGPSQKSLHDKFVEMDPAEAIASLGHFVPKDLGDKPKDGQLRPSEYLGLPTSLRAPKGSVA